MKKEKLKKILIVDNSSWNIYNFRLPLVKRLKKEGYTVVVATPVDEYIQYLNQTYFNRHIQIKHLARQGKNPFRDFIFLFELIRIFRQEQPDAVINFTVKPSIYGSLAARLFSIPVISVLTGLGYTFVHPNGLNRLVPWLMKFAFKYVQKLVVYNKEDWKVLTQKKIVTTSQATIAPGDGVDTTFYRPMQKAKENNNFVFLFIGRLLRDKGIEEYVTAAKKIKTQFPSSEFWVVGDLSFGNPSDIGRDQLVKWMEKQEIKYFATAKDIRKFICECDVLVLPSYREGLPRVILEAMSMEKPIITTDTAGCNEAVIHNQNGLIVPTKNAEALSVAMSYFRTTSREELRKIGFQNRKRVISLYGVENSTDAFMSLLGDIFGDSSITKNIAEHTFTR